MALLDAIPASWTGTADDLAVEIARLVTMLALDVKAPTVRTIRLWRTKSLLGKRTGRFERQQILQALAALALFQRGWSTTAIADRFATCVDADLERLILEAAAGVGEPPAMLPVQRRPRGNELAEEAVILLAQGILLQYRYLLPGREIVRQDDTVPPALHSAMYRIGRLYIEEGSVDRAACVHEVLSRARYPLGGPQWGLACFQAEGFRFANAVLIEPDLKVPTADCASIAKISGGFGEDNVVENTLHGRLREIADRFGARRHEAYAAIRELLARHSLIDERSLIQYLDDRSLSPVLHPITDEFYHHVPDAWLIRGHVHRCAHCRTLMRPHPNRNAYPDGVCPIRQCSANHAPELGERVDPASMSLLIARPQVLTYWTGPAVDELAIYDEARRLGLDAELYPESDLCDVCLRGRAVGIDAKSYSSPVSLALHFNRGIGGLINYRRRICAVGNEMLARDPSYIATVRSVLEPRAEQRTVEIMGVSAVLTLLKEMNSAGEA